MTLQITAMSESEAARIATSGSEAGLGALRTERGNLPLDRLDVSAEIVGLVSRVTLTQEFVNVHAEPLEATYVFPLPERAAVTGMRMTAADRVVEATLRERGEARQAYDEAVSAGQRAAIAEEERPDVFTMRVGNIVAGERVTVTLTLAGALPVEDGEATFRFPLVVAPRYIPGAPLPGAGVGDGYAVDTDAVPDASRITPPVLLPGFPNPVRLGIDVGIDAAGLPLGEVRSSLHTVSEVDGRLRISPGERADRDFVLRLAYGAAERSAALTLAPDEAGDEGTYQLTVLPPAGDGPARPRDVVLLLDRSGSMEGWKMVAARRAAARIVDTLVDADRFAVLAFDNWIETPDGLPDGLTAATDRNRYRAVEHLAKMTARGGTELLAPLRRGLELLAAPAADGTAGVGSPGERSGGARDRVLVLVTDGQVGNEDQILRESAASLSGVRVHTVGVDQAINAGFLGRLASAGGGRCELVESEDRLDEAMVNIHRRIGSPQVTGVRLDTSGLAGAGLAAVEGTQTPDRLPDVFPGVPYVVRGRYRREATGGGAPATVTISGTTRAGDAWSTSAEHMPPAAAVDQPPAESGEPRAAVDNPQSASGEPPAAVDNPQPASGEPLAAGGHVPALGAIWARSALRDLEDRYAMLSLSPDGTLRGQLERRIVQTSLRFGVLCRFTAYVAIDTRTVTGGGEPRRVIQPVEYPAGWQDPTSTGATPPQMMVAPAAMTLGAVAPAPFAAPSVRRAAPAGGAVPRIARALFKPSTTGGTRGGGPSGGSPDSGDAGGLAGGSPGVVRPWATTEAHRLREAEGEPGYARRELLEDLASRLAALVRDDTVDSRSLRPLVELLTSDRLRHGDIDELWREVLAALGALAGGNHPGGIDSGGVDSDSIDSGGLDSGGIDSESIDSGGKDEGRRRGGKFWT